MNGPLARHTHPQPRLRLFLAHAFPAAGAGRLLAPPCLAGVALNRPARPPRCSLRAGLRLVLFVQFFIRMSIDPRLRYEGLNGVLRGSRFAPELRD
jgi:hypothetical protein